MYSGEAFIWKTRRMIHEVNGNPTVIPIFANGTTRMALQNENLQPIFRQICMNDDCTCETESDKI